MCGVRYDQSSKIGWLENLLNALWKHERGIDPYNDTNVQS